MSLCPLSPTDSDEDEHRPTLAHLKMTFRHRAVIALIHYSPNEVLSLSAFVGLPDQSMDIV